jgi:hypothetical protein
MRKSERKPIMPSGFVLRAHAKVLGQFAVAPTFRACPEPGEWVGKSKKFKMPI